MNNARKSNNGVVNESEFVNDRTPFNVDKRESLGKIDVEALINALPDPVTPSEPIKRNGDRGRRNDQQKGLNLRGKSSREKRDRLLLLGGILLFGFALLDQSGKVHGSTKTQPIDSFTSGSEDGEAVSYRNPELSFYEEHLCRGGQTSRGCDKYPKHPYIQYVLDKFSMNYVEWYKWGQKEPPSATRKHLSSMERKSRFSAFQDK